MATKKTKKTKKGKDALCRLLDMLFGWSEMLASQGENSNVVNALYQKAGNLLLEYEEVTEDTEYIIRDFVTDAVMPVILTGKASKKR